MRMTWLAAGLAGALVACGATVSRGPDGGKPTGPGLGTSFKLCLKEQATVAGEGLTVRFEELLADSRCPKGVVCVWEGEAKIRVGVHRPPAAAAVRELSTSERGESPAPYEGYEVKLVDVTPYPEAGKTVQPSAYCAEINVTRVP